MSRTLRSVLVGLAAACTLAAAPLWAAEKPRFVVVAVNEGGTVLNALGNAIAKLIADKAAIPARLSTQSGLLDVAVNSGDADFAMGVSVESHMSSHGLEHYKGRRQTAIRLVSIGPALVVGVMVRKNAPYKTVADLKGAKLTSEYTAVRPIHFDLNAMLAVSGLTWNDVRKVPTESMSTAVQAFMDGSVDATAGALGAGFMRNAEASVGGIRFLTLANVRDLEKKLWDAQPGYYPIRIAKGASVGIVEDTVLAGKDIYFIANAKVSPDAVYAVAKAMWNDISVLHPVHPMFRDWTQKTMVKANATVPYHPGAVRFYKEVGAWSAEMDKRQAALLKGVGAS